MKIWEKVELLGQPGNLLAEVVQELLTPSNTERCIWRIEDSKVGFMTRCLGMLPIPSFNSTVN